MIRLLVSLAMVMLWCMDVPQDAYATKGVTTDTEWLEAEGISVENLRPGFQHKKPFVRYLAARTVIEQQLPQYVPELRAQLRDTYGLARIAAAGALLHLGRKEGVEVLTQALDDVDRHLTRQAAKHLVLVEDDDAVRTNVVKRLLQMIQTPEEKERWIIPRILTTYYQAGVPIDVQPIISIVFDPSEDVRVRRFCMYFLGEYSGNDVIIRNTMLKLIHNADSGIQSSAQHYLSKKVRKVMHPRYWAGEPWGERGFQYQTWTEKFEMAGYRLENIKALLGKAEKESVIYALGAAMENHLVEVIPELVALLNNDNQPTRSIAAGVLVRYGDVRGLPLVIQRLQSTDIAPRLSSIRVLAYWKKDPALQQHAWDLLKDILSTKDESLLGKHVVRRRNYLIATAQMYLQQGVTDDLTPLTKIVLDQADALEVRQAAVEVLARQSLTDHRVQEVMQQLLKDPDRHIREFAEWYLERAGLKEVAEPEAKPFMKIRRDVMVKNRLRG